jgi:SsrA-binding protein
MKVENRVFHRNYEELERFEAGVVLTGAEAKSVQKGNIKLENSFVKLNDEEAFLVNADIPIYQFTRPQDYDPIRRRKLLLHKKEILRLQVKMNSAGNLTIAPIACYTKGRKIKIAIALVKGRGDIGRKKLEKARDIAIDQKREMKDYMKE